MNQIKNYLLLFYLLVSQTLFSQVLGGLILSKNNFNIPENFSFNESNDYFLVSVYDVDYLPYTAPVSMASTFSTAADGVDESILINYQGTIPVLGLSIRIPVTATGSGILPRFAVKTIIQSDYAEDGVASSIVLSWEQQNYTSTTKFVTAKISAVAGVFNLKKLDINSGVGSDFLGITIGNFQFPRNSLGALSTLNLRLISGIPDKMFGVSDNAGDTSSHLMLYTPMLGEDGNIWLNNNLGAHYSNYNHTNFNPIQQALSNTDYLAYGSLFQWGRKPDGHELISFTSSTTATAVNGTTSTKSDVPSDALFITVTPWMNTTSDTSLWSAETSPNNPCPMGFRVPTLTELDGLFVAGNMTSYNSLLCFPYTGARLWNINSVTMLSGIGIYWTSTASGTLNAVSRSHNNSSNNPKSNGFCVRCIKNY